MKKYFTSIIATFVLLTIGNSTLAQSQSKKYDFKNLQKSKPAGEWNLK